MKVDVIGFILMLQKRASHVFLSVGAWFIIMLARVSVLARIVMGVKGLWLMCDLSISCLMKFEVHDVHDGVGWFNYFKDAYCIKHNI